VKDYYAFENKIVEVICGFTTINAGAAAITWSG